MSLFNQNNCIHSIPFLKLENEMISYYENATIEDSIAYFKLVSTQTFSTVSSTCRMMKKKLYKNKACLCTATCKVLINSADNDILADTTSTLNLVSR